MAIQVHFLDNRHRHSTTQLAFSRLSCGSQPTALHPLQAAQNRANLLPRMWFQVPHDLCGRLDAGPFLARRADRLT